MVWGGTQTRRRRRRCDRAKPGKPYGGRSLCHADTCAFYVNIALTSNERAGINQPPGQEPGIVVSSAGVHGSKSAIVNGFLDAHPALTLIFTITLTDTGSCPAHHCNPSAPYNPL